MTQILWIIAIYGFSMIAVHITHLWLQPQQSGHLTQHYVVRSYHNQLQIEWYIHSLLWFAWMKGHSIRITIMDEDSSDETLPIVNKLSMRYSPTIQVLDTTQHSMVCNELLHNKDVKIIDLRKMYSFQEVELI